MRYTENDLREWLGSMRRHASRDADRATDLLEMLDEAQAASEVGDAAYQILCENGLCIGDDPMPWIKRLAKLDMELSKLCVEAGFLAPGDRTTDVVPLLRMFLPVD